jgi:hypothetical protein
MKSKRTEMQKEEKGMAELEIDLGLETKLYQAIQETGSGPQTSEVVAGVIGELLHNVGLPGVAQVNLRAGIADQSSPALVTVRVNGHLLAGSPDLESRLLAVSLGRLLRPGENGLAILRWLVGQYRQPSEGARRQAVDFVALLTRSILIDHPETLLNDAIIAALRAQWSGHGSEGQKVAELDSGWLSDVLRELLQARLPLSNETGLIPALLCHGKVSPLEAAEAILGSLQPKTIGLQIPRSILRAYTLADERVPMEESSSLNPGAPTIFSANSFAEMEKQIFADLGLSLPPLEFEVTDHAGECFFFRIHGIQSPPWPALPPGQLLVDASPEELNPTGRTASLVLHPLGGRPCSLVATGDERSLPNQNWNGIEYLALCLASQLRAYRRCLVNTQTVNDLLQRTAENTPDLVKVVRTLYAAANSQVLLARTLRQLVDQGISMIDLPEILEALLDARLIGVPSQEWTVVGDAMPVPSGVAVDGWWQNPDILAVSIRWRRARPAISLTPTDRRTFKVVGVEQHAEPLTMQQRMTTLIKRYSPEEVEYLCDFLAIAVAKTPNIPSFFTDRREALLKKLEIDATTPPDKIQVKVVDYFTQNPVNPQLLLDFKTAASSAEVSHNSDAFTTLWRSKYGNGSEQTPSP